MASFAFLPYSRIASHAVFLFKGNRLSLIKEISPSGFILARSFNHALIARISSPLIGCVVDNPFLSRATCSTAAFGANLGKFQAGYYCRSPEIVKSAQFHLLENGYRIFAPFFLKYCFFQPCYHKRQPMIARPGASGEALPSNLVLINRLHLSGLLPRFFGDCDFHNFLSG